MDELDLDTSQAKAEETVASEVPESAPAQVDTPETPEAQQEALQEEHRKSVQRRIDSITREKYEARAEAKMLRQQLEALQREVKPQQAKPHDDQAPKPDQFERYEDYLEARAEFRAEFRADQKVRELLREYQQRTELDTYQTRIAQRWSEQQAKARESLPDFDDVVASAQDIPIPQAIAQAIVESERGAEIAYYLARNRNEAERITRLNPTQAAIAIGRIEAVLDEKLRPQSSQTPAPIKPVKGQERQSRSIYDENLSAEEWLKLRNKQIRERAGR